MRSTWVFSARCSATVGMRQLGGKASGKDQPASRGPGGAARKHGPNLGGGRFSADIEIRAPSRLPSWGRKTDCIEGGSVERGLGLFQCFMRITVICDIVCGEVWNSSHV